MSRRATCCTKSIPALYQAAYDQAKAALTTAEADLVMAEANLPAIRSRAERLKGLVAIHAVAQQDYDDASAALRQAEANLAARRASVEINRAALESARINLSYTPIKAPISGRIGISNITVGALATAYQPTPWRSFSSWIPFTWMWFKPARICCACGSAWRADVSSRMARFRAR